MLFRDRREAGQALAGRLRHYAGRSDVVVLGLARGGVPVAHAVASRLGVALDVFTVRKLGVPGHEELAMGAIASGGVLVLSEELIQALGIPAAAIEEVAAREQRELDRRGRVVIVVDDGLATGSSMRAAVAALRQKQPARLVVAAPIAAGSTCDELSSEVDEVICAVKPEPFYGVGSWYRDFTQTSDAEVRELLGQAGEGGGTSESARPA